MWFWASLSLTLEAPKSFNLAVATDSEFIFIPLDLDLPLDSKEYTELLICKLTRLRACTKLTGDQVYNVFFPITYASFSSELICIAYMRTGIPRR